MTNKYKKLVSSQNGNKFNDFNQYKIIDFLRNKIWYNSSMNYEASKQLTDVRFKRLVGVQRTT
ncbi:hypothetical protein ACMG8K_09720, partial [Streptococcus agalactiae]